ncbi:MULTISPECIES: lipopolysaccharide assembly protein LapB [unclassified Gemella]|uniref:tetratricopeptide repeat protein n=1 Tax=unclassified Gemella TaxID=2624949 RepID=UPI0010748513|nr:MULTISPECIES: slei family protein [unclassified Gemella]MBF0710062.1 slei family protein [Gemella sp. GL1.1]MBF0746141.1 slei family protein [Gemella sp. 19428wG2_WT2a]NYS27406.1 slei family protein [Gemella sp. GL1]TFU60429.1 slei family protein [Gemella sp. WT2a]
MDFQKFLDEYNELNLKTLDREQLEAFRGIFVEHGELEKALEISKIIYETYDDEAAIVSYADNLMHLDKKDDALLVLYKAPKTSQVIFLEGIIYQNDGLTDVAEDKFRQALKVAGEDMDLKFMIESYLVNLYTEEGRNDEALQLAFQNFQVSPSLNTFVAVLDNLIYSTQFEEAIEFYNENGHKYDDASIYFAVSFTYNQLGDIEKSKEFLLKTIKIDNQHQEAYMHLGFMSIGQEAINYFEKYLDLQGASYNVYLQLTSLYKQEERYNDIRLLVRKTLKEMGIDVDTLYVAINALRELYETEKVYEIYKEHNIIKNDAPLLTLALLTLSEEEDYIDFVEEEVIKYHEFIKEEYFYYELLQNIYQSKASKTIEKYLTEVQNLRLSSMMEE